MVSAIIPTVEGREEHLARCLRVYEQTPGVEPVVVHGEPTCGRAWNVGAGRANGDYLHFTADDLVPGDGWLDAALLATNLGLMPAPRILRPDGSLESCGDTSQPVEHPDGWRAPYSAIPFMPRGWWERIGPSLDCHYYTDDWLSVRARRIGIEIPVVRDYLFTHYRAEEGRGAGMEQEERMTHDRAIYERALESM